MEEGSSEVDLAISETASEEWCGTRTHRRTLRESRAVWAGAQLYKTHFGVRSRVLQRESRAAETTWLSEVD